MSMQTMYLGQVNSPATTLTQEISAIATTIDVTNAAVFPAPPNLLVLGIDSNAETVLYTSVNANSITVQRGFQGSAKIWPAGTFIRRAFTAYDHDTFRQNINTLNTTKVTSVGGTGTITSSGGLTPNISVTSGYVIPTTSEKGGYDTAYSHSQVAHAPSGAQVNQNAFSNVIVSGQNAVVADSPTDSLTLIAGSNVVITTDSTADSITIAAASPTYSSGDITGSGTLTISNGAVTLAKMANVNTGTIFYRKTALAGAPEVQTLATLKQDMGLDNVTNTSDVNKPISTAQQTALDLKANTLSPVFTGTPQAPTATIGTNTTQVATTAFVQSAMTQAGNLVLGTTSDTAHRGDHGVIAYNHSQLAHAPSGAEVNQNTFSTIAVSGQTDVVADTKTDTLTFVAGTNMGITTNGATDTITFNAQPTVFSTGDVTGTTSLTIANQAVTLAKMVNMPESSLIYRRSPGTGIPEVNTLAQLKLDLGDISPYEHTHNSHPGIGPNDHHNQLHSISSTSDHSATNWKVFYSNGSGQIQELALGTSGTVLQSNGMAIAPSWGVPPAGTRLRGALTGTYVSGDITITGTGAATITQTGNVINVDSTGGSEVPNLTLTTLVLGNYRIEFNASLDTLDVVYIG